MKTLEEILEKWDEEYKVALEDRLGRRICDFLTVEQAKKIGFEFEEPEKHVPKEWTEENILAQLKEDVDFGFEKALNQRSISASLMFEVVKGWCKILENGLDDVYDYPMYGLPLFKAVAVKYGFENPIGDDDGSEEKYNCQ